MDAKMIRDRIAICELKARYCRLLDTAQWDEWADLFTEDLVLDTSEAGGPPPVIGRAAAVAMVRQTLEGASTVHQVFMPEISISGDCADGIWAMQDRLIWPGVASLTGYGHYAEHYIRRDGTWKIARSKLTRLIVDSTPPPQ